MKAIQVWFGRRGGAVGLEVNTQGYSGATGSTTDYMVSIGAIEVTGTPGLATVIYPINLYIL